MRKLIVTTQKTKINWADEAEKEDLKKIYVVYNKPKSGNISKCLLFY